MRFKVDERIQSTSIELADWPLSRLFLKNESRLPWFILIPRVEGVEEIYQLDEGCRNQLIQEITKLSHEIKAHFKPDKINVANLGNMVRQLHIHVVGRYEDDPFWPHSLWQPSFSPIPYESQKLTNLINILPECFK
ncbi:HIT domain-containing protein [Legionella yabuuchiae]|uniref:HIT domain-containing protein n=1 Tax=Legionella yabuuchiae TaxID=376727 RepID=UPI0010542484|nr:HIT domain-containing protein [Legionella yabuuchiae]